MRAKLRSNVDDNRARDSVYPYKIVAALLYEPLLPGVQHTEKGNLIITFSDFKRHMGRAMNWPLPVYLQIIKDMGIFEKCIIHKNYAIVTFNLPGVFRDV